jgi:hypothetical protein
MGSNMAADRASNRTIAQIRGPRLQRWRIALALSPLLALVAGCTNDECTQADSLIAACAPPTQSIPSTAEASMTLVCGGTRLCQATCINQASCLAIEALQCIGQVSCPPLTCNSPAAPLAACIQACGGMDAGVVMDAGTDGGSCPHTD